MYQATAAEDYWMCTLAQGDKEGMNYNYGLR
jgi:hypothetical protein